MLHLIVSCLGERRGDHCKQSPCDNLDEKML